MKRMQKALLAISAVCLATQLSAVNDPGFSLRNKSPKDIFIEIKSGNQPKRTAKLLSGGLLVHKIDLIESTSLVIQQVSGGAVYRYGFTVGKSLYLNWDGIRLYPQRGPLSGLTGKTDEGYPLKNNVKERDIFQTM